MNMAMRNNRYASSEINKTKSMLQFVSKQLTSFILTEASIVQLNRKQTHYSNTPAL